MGGPAPSKRIGLISIESTRILLQNSAKFRTLCFCFVLAQPTKREDIQTAYKPGSVHACRQALDGHSSGAGVTARLNATNPGGGSKTLPRPRVAARRRPPLFGLAPGGVYPANLVAKAAVRFYRTVSPMPQANQRRFVFCGTVPGVAPAGR